MRRGSTKGVFPPVREAAPDKTWSLWREQRLTLVMAKHMLLETISFTNLVENIHRLASLCANSKRKRIPLLYRLLVPK
ncbi:MAG: hypothetical protein LBK73_02655 [Treponema sp.]|nr:hypothetical protein [Treponema sp.]